MTPDLPPNANAPLLLKWLEEGKVVVDQEGLIRGRAKTPCWLWQRALNGAGYGWVSLRGQANLAHRLAVSAPKGVDILHACDTPACVNPWHLREGDQKANSLDTRGKKCKHGICPTPGCGRAKAKEVSKKCPRCYFPKGPEAFDAYVKETREAKKTAKKD